MLVIIYCVHAVLACFKTKIYSKSFRFLATTTEKRVTWGTERRLQIHLLNVSAFQSVR